MSKVDQLLIDDENEDDLMFAGLGGDGSPGGKENDLFFNEGLGNILLQSDDKNIESDDDNDDFL